MLSSKFVKLQLTKSNASDLLPKLITSSSRRSFSYEQIGKHDAKPWDYKNKRYGLWGQFTDSTMRRLGENSLIITVEGNFGSGKSRVAKELAKKIDFVYAREPCLEEHLFKLPNGHSKRDIINELTKGDKRYRLDSLEEWHREPSFKRAIQLQHQFYTIRWMQMRTALLHLMSTGQGVVLERSVFSDPIIGKSLYENGFLSDEAYRFYARDLTVNTMGELWRPHVCIYLEKSPEQCLASVKAQGKPQFERESRVYNLAFLQSMEKNYKRTFLPEARQHMHVLSYQPDEVRDAEKIVDDLEMLDFEDETKFQDWRVRRETTINVYRKILSHHEYCYDMVRAPNGYIDVPEYLLYGEELVSLKHKLDNDERYDESIPGENLGLFSSLGSGTGERNWL
jgi:NADH dehydrogenase (ubiquinone) 1 alpha subcomplex subunit 10